MTTEPSLPSRAISRGKESSEDSHARMADRAPLPRGFGSVTTLCLTLALFSGWVSASEGEYELHQGTDPVLMVSEHPDPP